MVAIRSSSVALAWWSIAAGCGEPSTSTGSTSATTTAAPTTSAASTESGDPPTPTTGPEPAAWPPAACAGLGSPFLDAGCLGELREACRSLTSEAACADQEPLTFSDGDYIVWCGWAKVVQFSDIDACTVASTTGRCEAGLEYTLFPCGDRCTDEPDLHFSLHAEVAAMELIEMPCTPAGSYLGGPLGPDSAVGAEKGEFGSTCAPNIQPPAPPLCMCRTVACEAE